MKLKWFAIPALLSLAVVGTVAALPVILPFWEAHRPRPNVPVDAAMRSQAIEALVTQMNAHYIFPDKAARIAGLLRQRQQHGAYDALINGEQLAAQLTADMAGIAHDLHLEVEFSPETLPPERPPTSATTPPATAPAGADANFAMRWIDQLGRSIGKFGVDKVDHLSPGIGYLKMSRFSRPEHTADKYAAAMDKLADTDALIIDMRGNSGGSPGSVNLLISYFVDERTRLNDLWSRDTGVATPYWTDGNVAGTRYGGKKPVVILVGPGTRSAGEDFAYTMQALKRATVIGAPTWGGAHPTGNYRLGDHFFVWLPNQRSISPITHANWEGVGVVPDIAATPANALAAATELLQRRIAATTR